MVNVICPRARVVPGGVFQACAAISLLVGSVLCVGGLGVLLQTPAVTGLGALALLPFFLHRVWSAARERVPLEVGEGALRVGARRIDLEDVAGAYARTPHEVVVELVDRTRFELSLAPETRAEEVLAAFGWDPARRTLRAPLRGQLGAFTVGFLAFVLAMWPATTAWEALVGPSGLGLGFALASAGLASAAMIRLVAKPHAVIGADGVRVVRGPGRQRFVPYASILGVEATAAVVRLTLDSGEELDLPTVGQEPDQIRSLVARVEAGRAGALAQGAGLASLLERGGRGFDAWVKELGAVAGREAGFRSVAISPEMLERELRDTTAPAERRIAAAIALRATPDADAARVRVRVVADTCADPELRAALDAVCDDELEEDHVERAGRRVV